MRFTVDGNTVDGDELERMMVSKNVPGTRERLKAGRVAIAGAGGLGSHIARALVRAGVGELLIVDCDLVEPSNLNRQSYGISHLGMRKVDALKKQLADINCFVNVRTVHSYITESNAVDIFKGYDVVCEALDNPVTKAMLVSTLLSKLPNVKVVAASGMAGAGSSNDIKTTSRLNRLYVCGDGATAAEAGLMAPLVLVCAGHQANMAMRLILGFDRA